MLFHLLQFWTLQWNMECWGIANRECQFVKISKFEAFQHFNFSLLHINSEHFSVRKLVSLQSCYFRKVSTQAWNNTQKGHWFIHQWSRVVLHYMITTQLFSFKSCNSHLFSKKTLNLENLDTFFLRFLMNCEFLVWLYITIVPNDLNYFGVNIWSC
jgi:hypothetical protein